MSKYNEMLEAVREAEAQINTVDRFVDKLCQMLLGRLRKVKSYGTLRTLKRELSEYDANKRQWKS